MSNIGFMQSSTKYIEKLYKKYMDNSKKNPTKKEKEDYLYLLQQFEIMHKHGEIEDEELYDILLRRLKQNDLTTLVDHRKKLKKTEVNKRFG